MKAITLRALGYLMFAMGLGSIGVGAVLLVLAFDNEQPPDPRDAAIAEFGADLEDLADTVRRLQAAQAQQKGAE